MNGPTLFELTADANKYENLILVHESDYDILIDEFLGHPMESKWKPLRTAVLRDRAHRNRRSSDFPSLGGTVPVFSEAAVSALGEFLRKGGELLLLDCDEGNYAAYNCLRVLDVLDEEESELTRFDSGRVMHIYRYAFKNFSHDANPIFKIPQMIESRHYVTRRFVDAVSSARLTGFRFLPL